jgi:hypothetical protein
MLKRIAILLVTFILCGAVGSAQNDDKYVLDSLRTNDSLSAFAKRHKIKVNDFLLLNKLDDKKVKTGKLYKVKLKETPQQENSAIQQERTRQNKENSQETTPAPKKDKQSSSWWWFWLFLGFGGGIFAWEKWLREKKAISIFFQNPSKIAVEQSYRNDYRNEIAGLKNDIKELTKKNEDLDTENKAYRKECDGKQRQYEKAIQELREYQQISQNVVPDIVQQVTIPSQPAPATNNPAILFADTITDGFFNRVKETSDEDTIFELHLQNEQTATFTICDSARQRVIAISSFLEGCDKQVLNNAHDVETVSEGTACRDVGGRWRIINKLNVIIK